MLPAAGYRHFNYGLLSTRGQYGVYWSSTEYKSDSAWHPLFDSSYASTGNYNNRNYGFSVRCVEDGTSQDCTFNISSSSGDFVSSGGSASVSVTASDHSCHWATGNSLSWVSLDPTSGTGSGSVTVTVSANTGAVRNGSTTIAGKPFTINQEAGSIANCGAYIAPGVWKEFNCYNLAAIGKTTNDDPFTPSWRLIGGYWQWGRKGPDSSQWLSNNTPNFAHGPTGSSSGEANSSSISLWDTTDAPDGSWSDTTKTANDPCPVGFRVPTKSQWGGIINYNTQSVVGSWNGDAVNYSSGRFFGNGLMLPAAGYRPSASGSLDNRGGNGYYWSSTQYMNISAWELGFGSSAVGLNVLSRRDGYSVRCVAE